MGERPTLYTQNMGCTLASPDHHPQIQVALWQMKESMEGSSFYSNMVMGLDFQCGWLLTKPESISSLRSSPRTNEFF